MTAPIERLVSRVFLLDAQDRLLLFRGCDPAEPDVEFWFTPGGGRDPGESAEECAARELYEETGLRVEPDVFGPVVHERVTAFPFNGDTYRSEEEYFLLRVDSHEVETHGFEALEHASIFGHRWWPLDELRTTTDTVYPEELLDVLGRVRC
jgi:8-oxo-dGTP pyrophosphatase MutT (NUDIX family)